MKRFAFAILSVLAISCETQNPEHYPDRYNQEVDRVMFNNYYPRQHDYSFVTSGNSVYIKSTCPVVVSGDKYITLSFELDKDLDTEDIALLNIFMHKKECIDNKCYWKPVADKYYLPNTYSNIVRIKNYLPDGEYRVWYGFYLKKDSVSDLPRFHKTTCYLSLD